MTHHQDIKIVKIIHNSASYVFAFHKCGRGTYAKYQVCVKCGAHKIRLKHKYMYIVECNRLRQIDVS